MTPKELIAHKKKTLKKLDELHKTSKPKKVKEKAEGLSEDS